MLLCATGVWSFGPNGCAEKYAGEASDLELLRSPATDLPTGQYNVGEKGSALDECTGAPCQDRRLWHIPAAAELWNPPPAARHLCLCAV